MPERRGPTAGELGEGAGAAGDGAEGVAGRDEGLLDGFRARRDAVPGGRVGEEGRFAVEERIDDLVVEEDVAVRGDGLFCVGDALVDFVSAVVFPVLIVLLLVVVLVVDCVFVEVDGVFAALAGLAHAKPQAVEAGIVAGGGVAAEFGADALDDVGAEGVVGQVQIEVFGNVCEFVLALGQQGAYGQEIGQQPFDRLWFTAVSGVRGPT